MEDPFENRCQSAKGSWRPGQHEPVINGFEAIRMSANITTPPCGRVMQISIKKMQGSGEMMLRTTRNRGNLVQTSRISSEVPNMQNVANLLKLNWNGQAYASVRCRPMPGDAWYSIEMPLDGQKKICLIALFPQPDPMPTALRFAAQTEPAFSLTRKVQACPQTTPSCGNAALQLAAQEPTLMPRTPGHSWRPAWRRVQHISSTTPP